MRVDNLTVDRFNTVETTTLRQGSQQVEQTTQNKQDTVVKQDSVKTEVEKKVKEKEVRRTQEQETDLEELKKAIDQANKSFKPMNRRFEYSVHEALPRIFVTVIDSNTNEVIREIPSEKLLDMVANMLEVAGIIVDERA